MSQSGVYSESKLTWWYAREQQLPDVPKQVQMIISDLCNQDCHFCAYRLSGYTSNELFMEGAEAAGFGHSNPKRWMNTERALALLEEFRRAGVLSIQFTGGGEPTVHPEYEEIFEKALNLGLRCSLVSNGVHWSPYLIESLLPRFDWVRVSIDAATRESYVRLRRTHASAWEKVWKNVKTLTGTIRAAGTPCVLGLGFVVTPQSYREIVPFASMASTSGAHNVRFTAQFSPEDDKPFRDIYGDVRGKLTWAKSYAKEGFAVHDNFGSRLEDLRQGKPDYDLCPYQYYTSYVGGDFRAYRCCVLAYNRRGRIEGGDLSDRAWDEFWASDQRRRDMHLFDPKECPRCQFNAKNRGLLYVMGNTESDVVPRHLEWP